MYTRIGVSKHIILLLKNLNTQTVFLCKFCLQERTALLSGISAIHVEKTHLFWCGGVAEKCSRSLDLPLS